jgi:hypothetical protein
MWHDIDDQILPVGVVSVDGRKSKVTFGARTVRTWKLLKFRSVNVKTNGIPGLVAFQMYADQRGTRRVNVAKSHKLTLTIACSGALRMAEPNGRYSAKLESAGFVTVDFSHRLPQGWRPQAQRRRDDK